MQMHVNNYKAGVRVKGRFVGGKNTKSTFYHQTQSLKINIYSQTEQSNNDVDGYLCNS